MSISLIKKARTLGIPLFCLPPNTAHILQPLRHQCVWSNEAAVVHNSETPYDLPRVSYVTKEHFPALIKQLWEKAIKPGHLQAGFRAAGLMTFNPQAVKPAQLVPSYAAASPSVVSTGEVTAVLTINKGETPIRAELRGYFREVLRPASGRSKPQRRRRIELCCAGEVLTSDEVVERMERAVARKVAEKAVKKTFSKSKKKEQLAQRSHRRRMLMYIVRNAHRRILMQRLTSGLAVTAVKYGGTPQCAGLPAMLTKEDEWLCDYYLSR